MVPLKHNIPIKKPTQAAISILVADLPIAKTNEANKANV